MAVKATKEAAKTASTHATLTPAEEQTLVECEQTIRTGLDTFIEVGNALLVIRDQSLYRSSHATFEAYVRDKWKFTARQANRLIGAGGVVENLKRDQLVSDVPAAIPLNEAQARPLAALTPPQQVKAAQIVASKTSEPTAKDFEEAAGEVAEEKASITVGKPAKSKPVTGKASLETLIELIDEVETMVKAGRPKEAVLAKLKAAADLATHINNGGRVC